jgi:hypothetical protein
VSSIFTAITGPSAPGAPDIEFISLLENALNEIERVGTFKKESKTTAKERRARKVTRVFFSTPK